MKMILRRNDNTSIYCQTKKQHRIDISAKTKGIEVTIACILITVGFFVMIIMK